MDLIKKLLPGEGTLTYQGVNAEVESHEIVVRMKSEQRVACCPVCGRPSQRQHSRYERTVQDLPWAAFRVIIRLEVGKWFCQNPTCRRRIFTERLPHVVRPWGRRTDRLAAAQTVIGLTTGGRVGAGLSRMMQMLTSRGTLLRLVRRQPLKEMSTPHVLGIDDWAKRKGQTYGTLMVDLEQHHVVDVLPERSAECVEQWLRAHPGVEIISRDRGGEYATGAAAGAPQARQVADRFHLLKNVGDALTEALKPYSRELRAISHPSPPAHQGAAGPTVTSAPATTEPASTSLSPRTVRQRTISQEKQAKRRVLYERVCNLHEQGWMQKTIAREVQLSAKTVSRWLAAGAYPERGARAARVHRLDPYRPYLLERWASGCRNAAYLCREIQAMGYAGGVTMVRDFMALLRRAAGLPAGSHALAPGLDPLTPALTPRALTTILFKPVSKRTEGQGQLLTQVREHLPDLLPLLQLVEAFILMVRQRLHTALDAWLDTAATFPAFGPLVKGLRRDYAAVYAALSTEWSNGQTEGQVNRLKFLKRQGYGRANFDLLRRRVLLVGA